MSRWLRSRIRRPRVSLGLSASGVAMTWRGANGALAHRVASVVIGEVPDAVVGWMKETAELAALLAGSPVSVTLAEDLVRWWLVTAPPGARSLAELEAFAKLRHEELFGHPADGGTMACRWRLDGPSVCCAQAASAAKCADTLVARLGWRLSEVSPATQRLMDIWRTKKRSAGAVVCRSASDRAVAWWLVDGLPVELRTVRLPAENPAAALDRELARVSSRRSEVTPGRAVVLDVISRASSPELALSGADVDRYELAALAAVKAESPAAMAAAIGAAHLEGAHELVAAR
ncbi:hypothetical protein AACH06_12010 [Ideonella sp. DXS29W]|uniref:Uncharacterized protein n=1 Tax=Ideonella lacteola TaxID=2984193 RepID=A0ABU9BSQ7_9BURK